MKKINILVPIIHPQPYLLSLYSELLKNNAVSIYEYNNASQMIFGIFKVDLIHLHWIESLFIEYYKKPAFLWTFFRIIFYIFFLILAKIFQKKIVITLHNVVPHKRMFPHVENKLFKTSLMIADHIIVHNNYAIEKTVDLYKIPDDKISVIELGNFDIYPNSITKKESRKLLEIPEDFFAVVFFGNIAHYKGIRYLLESFRDLFESEKDVFLIIAGSCADEKLKKELKEFNQQFIHNSFVKLDYIDDNDIQIFINSADVGALPYTKITASAVLFLFAAFGKPVIVSDLPPLMDFLGESGIYFESKNSNDLKDKIMDVKKGFHDLDTLSGEMLEISKKYDWESIAPKTLFLFQKLLE